MDSNKFRAITCVLLLITILFTACSAQNKNTTTTAAADTAAPTDITGETDTAEVTVTDASEATRQSTTKTVSYEYVTAKLDGNELTLTFSYGNNNEYKSYLPENTECGRAYPVSGLNNSYTDLCIGTMGQDIYPFVFLLTDRKTVECVPAANQLSNQKPLACMGELPGVSDVTALHEGTVTDENGSGYVTVFASKADGSEYNLSEVWLRMNSAPEDITPTDEAAIEILSGEQDVQKQLRQGMKMLVTDSMEYLRGELCRLVDVGTDHEESFVSEYIYAVSSTGAIYLFRVAEDEWVPINMLAETYSAARQESNYLTVFYETGTDEYKYYSRGENIIEINTLPAEQNDTAKIFFMPMHSGMTLRIESLKVDMNTGSITADSVLETIENTTRGEIYSLKAAMSETIPALRIVASFEGLSCEWYAVHDGADENGIAYVCVK